MYARSSCILFFQAEDGIRDAQESRGLGDVYKRQGVDGSACAPDNIILAGTASGSNVQYSWQTNGAGSITNPNALNTSYTPVLADFTAGTVSFTLTATDQTGFCPSDQETIDIDIDATAYFLSLIHISEPTRLLSISYAVFCLKKKKLPPNINTSTTPHCT